MRQLLPKAGNLGFGAVFILLLLFFLMGGEEINGFKLGIYLLFGFSLGLQPITAVWGKAQLRALGMSVADIRRNLLIVMPVASAAVCGAMLLGYGFALIFSWHIPAFWVVLGFVFLVHVVSIIGALARVADNSEVVKASTSAAEEDETAQADKATLAGLFDAETRWRQQEKKSSNPTALDYLATWQIDSFMVWMHLAGLIAIVIGVIGWFASGLTASGAMWLYPAAMILLVAAYYCGEMLNSSLRNWLVLSGDRRSWYATAMGRLALWMPGVALLVLIGTAQFALLSVLFPGVGDVELQLSGKGLLMALLVAATVAMAFGSVAIVSFWVSNRFSGWMKWVASLIAIMLVSSVMAVIIVSVQEIDEAGTGLLGPVGTIFGAVAVMTMLVFAALRWGIGRFDTAHESIEENLGVSAEA
ncbi:ABC transporter permease [Corynebacterium jeikeium]|nr:ABC transporter permease [Corynebacterium jeikeium]